MNDQKSGDKGRADLLASKGLGALSSEAEVAEALRSLGWSATHSVYFKDADMGKIREIDVVGELFWSRPATPAQLEALNVSAAKVQSGVALLVECKSASGSHLI